MKRFLVILLLFIISNNNVLCLDLRIGLSWSSTIADPFLPQETKERLLNMAKYTKIGSEVFAEWARQNDFYIGDEKLNLELVILEDDYSKESVQNNYRQLIDDGIDFLIAGFGSERSEFAAEITEERGKVLVSPSSTNESFSLNKDYAFSVFPNPVTSHAPFYPLYRLAGVNSVTFLKTPDAPRLVRREGCKGFEAELQKNLIYNFSYVEFTANLTAPDVREQYSKAVDKIMEIDSDLLIFCDLETPPLKLFLELFIEKKYTPRGAMSLAIDLNIDQSLLEFWTAVLTVSRDQLNYPDGSLIKNEEEYLKLYRAVTKTTGEIDDVTVKLGYFGAAAVEIIVSAVNISQSLDPRVVSDYIRRNIYQSFIGEFSYDARNVLLYPSNSVQYVGRYLNILAPNTIVNGTLIYPMPTWDEREFKDEYSGIEIAVMVILSVFIINSIIWGIVIWIKRKEKVIVASSPIFLVCMLIGSVFIYVSLYFWTPNMKTTAGCSIHVAFLLFGFTLLFGSMLVKTWRVHLLFSRNTLEVFRVSNTQVGIFLSILLAVDLVLYIIWIVLTKPSLERVIVDEYRPSHDYFVCKTTTGGTIVVWIMVGYHILLFLYGAYLALRVRTVPFKIYDESKIIAFCIYNVGLVAIIVAIIEGASASSNRSVQFALRSFLIMLSTAVTINTMFIGKIAAPRLFESTSNTDTSSIKDSRFQSIDRSSSPMPTNNYEEECNKLRKKVKKLKAEIKEYKEALEALKNQ